MSSGFFLTADSESTQKVTSIANFLTWKQLFPGGNRLNPVFGQNPAFVVREQLTEFRQKPRSDSETSCSKAYPSEWNPFFFEIQNTLCETPKFGATPNLEQHNGARCFGARRRSRASLGERDPSLWKEMHEDLEVIDCEDYPIAEANWQHGGRRLTGI